MNVKIDPRFEEVIDHIQTFYLEAAGDIPYDKLNSARNAVCDLFGIDFEEYLDELLGVIINGNNDCGQNQKW